MEYYQDILTKKSFDILRELKNNFDFILIGGWAVFLHTHSLKSKDIDIIVDYNELNKIRDKYELLKNERLKKYEIKIEQIDVDIYLPYFSKIGIPPKDAREYSYYREGFLTVTPEFLLVLKLVAFSERERSVKGEKDKMDIISILSLDNFNFPSYRRIIKKYHLKEQERKIKEIFREISEVKELKLNQHKFSKIKTKVLKELNN